MGADIIYHQARFSALGDRADAFRAFAVLGGEVISVHRRFRLHRTDQLFQSRSLDSDVVLTRRVLKSGWFRPAREEVLGQGSDPRIVSDGIHAYVVYADYLADHGFRGVFRVVELPSRQSCVYEHTDFPMGKNWQPFLRDGRLFVLHGFAPARVIELCRDGRIETVTELETDHDQIAPHDGYTIFRGGSNGVRGPSGDVYGFGHFTFTNYTHAPFPWRLTQDGTVQCGDAMMFPAFRAQGYHLHDVTSYFIHEDHAYLGLTLTERDWFHAQRMVNVLLRVPGDDPAHLFDNPGVWADVGQGLPDSKDVQTIFPCDQGFDGPVEDHLGSRKSLGQPGFVVLTKDVLNTHPERAYRLEVSYRCPNATAHEVGFVRLGGYQGAKLAHPPHIAALHRTEDADATAIIEFTAHEEIGHKLSVCTFGPELFILNIRLCEL